VNGLAGNTEGVADLLPRPTPATRGGYVGGLDALRETTQRERGAEATSRVLGRDRGGESFDVHAVSLA
jgi:hypothetical protein